ncbi:hypothetical protein AB833_02140 [Chromatiales bacterium (ex Bugula neritina AB1)]|nr:hypothetical protein AB833_02140 [Chromatiales bacterium (ex Bugula neritina AB1)]
MAEYPFNSLLLPLLKGLLITLELAGIVLVLGTVLGVLGGILSVWGGRVVRLCLTFFIFIIRGVPLLVQIFLVFFALPLAGIKLSAFMSAVLALSVFATATITEIVRGGIQSVSSGQMEAAKAVGFSHAQAVRIVVLPQATMFMLPPLITQWVLLVKSTAIISLLGVPELMLAGREVIERTLLGLEVMTLIWLMYTAICFPLTVLGRRLEANYAARGLRSVVS